MFLQKAEITLKTLFIVGLTVVFVFTVLRQVTGFLLKNQSCKRPQELTESATESWNPNTTMLRSSILLEYFVSV